MHLWCVDEQLHLPHHAGQPAQRSSAPGCQLLLAWMHPTCKSHQTLSDSFSYCALLHSQTPPCNSKARCMQNHLLVKYMLQHTETHCLETHCLERHVTNEYVACPLSCAQQPQVPLHHLVSTNLAVDLLKPLCRPGSCTPRACALTPLHTSRTTYTTCRQQAKECCPQLRLIATAALVYDQPLPTRAHDTLCVAV